ncbi:MAG: DUF2971 domain-containing protein [Desulfobacteraceae bacterium]|nr:DUF2971 domain-containing protein [Desulfobacteraceae bacterium]
MCDYVIFKFRKIDKNTLKSLVNSELYFARPDCLNDPFDCQVDIVASFENAVSRADELTRNLLEQIRHNEYLIRVQTEIESMGVCAFSLALENRLMWSHYADDHRGICLTYAIPQSFIDVNVDKIIGITNVDYDNTLSDWFLNEVPKLTKLTSFEEYAKTLLKKALTVKAKEWGYEEEVRFLRRSAGVQVIDKKYLIQICFGMATPDQDIDFLTNLIRQCGYNVDLCKMVPSRSSDFGLEPIEI